MSHDQSQKRIIRIVLGLIGLLCPLHLAADAIIRTQAMFATTIAEYFVEEDGITVNLEIGARDLEAFKNLMPDDIYERLGKRVSPATGPQPDSHFRRSHRRRGTDSETKGSLWR